MVTRIFRRLIRPVIALEKVAYEFGLIKSGELSLPDFLCIGVEKAGTTWLYENLRLHPEVFLPVKKELDYFGSNYRFYSYPFAYYCANFNHSPKGLLKGEFTPYCTMPINRIRFLRKVMPDVKLLLILRNPIQRLWSACLMHLVGRDKCDARKLSNQKLKEVMLNEKILAFGFYPEILRKWRSVFPIDQIKVVFYDDLVEQPKQFLGACCRFLDISDVTLLNGHYIDKRINQGPDYRMPQELVDYFRAVYRESIIDLSTEFGNRVMKWLDNAADDFLPVSPLDNRVQLKKALYEGAQ